MNEYKCFCCNKSIESEPIDNPIVIHPVYSGLIFRSVGNFGSTIFDPMPSRNEEMLQVIICEECIKTKIERVTRIYNIKRRTFASSEPFVIDEENSR